MLTRSDILNRSTAPRPLPPFAVTADQAAAQLKEPAEFDASGERPSTWAGDLLDPVSFADSIDGIDLTNHFEHGAAEEMATFEQAFHQMIDAFGITVRDLPFDHPLHKLHEAALAMWCASWMAGVRAGAQYEHLRLALVSTRMSCATCDGQGETWGGRWYRDESKLRETCRDCDGTGTIATPAATLPLGR